MSKRDNQNNSFGKHLAKTAGEYVKDSNSNRATNQLNDPYYCDSQPKGNPVVGAVGIGLLILYRAIKSYK